jgi:dolichol-phosphate mannosyltransferase
MMMTGIMGLYVGRIYSEVKGRPLYVIDKSVGFEAEAGDALRASHEARLLQARRAAS